MMPFKMDGKKKGQKKKMLRPEDRHSFEEAFENLPDSDKVIKQTLYDLLNVKRLKGDRDMRKD